MGLKGTATSLRKDGAKPFKILLVIKKQKKKLTPHPKFYWCPVIISYFSVFMLKQKECDLPYQQPSLLWLKNSF